MTENGFIDHYEILQISPNAEAETVQRVYRMLASRYHPDNKETGSEAQLRVIREAYRVLSDSALRADARRYVRESMIWRCRLFTDQPPARNCVAR